MSAVDSKRVYAMVVGVEKYNVSSRWDLPGAARDAARVAAWLIGPGKVPAANVRLHLSGLSRTAEALTKEIPEGLRTAVLPATQEKVEATLFDDLPGCDGDLLWLFWAGHGFLDDRHQLLLPYADATKEHTRHLNLESALRQWKSSKVPKGCFERQVVIGDACRVHDGPRSPLTFGRQDYGAGDILLERRQFVLYASRPGEAAQNLAERGAGQFTDLFLGRLRDRTLERSIAELVDIAREMQADFGQLHREGTGWQTPQFFVDRGWDDSPIFGEPWASDSAARPQRLDQIAWDQLAELLTKRALPPSTYDAYRWAFDVAGCVPPPTTCLPSGTLMDLVRDLDNRQGGREMPLAIPFVRYLASRVDDSDWAVALESWAATSRERLGAGTLPVPPEQASDPVAVHIRLTPASSEGHYWLHVWLHRDRFECIWTAEQPMDLVEVQTQVGQQLSSLYAIDAGEPLRTGAADVRRLEFHIPFDLLDEAFEQWTAPIGRAGKMLELGRQFEVLVRCPDERTGIAGRYWLRKWHWFKANGGRHPDAVNRVNDEDAGQGATKTLHMDDSPVCVLAEVSPEHLHDVLSDVLDGGVPIAVWPRGHADQRTVTTMLGGSAGGDSGIDLRELPAAVYRLRSGNGQQGQAIALLWDDPKIRPDLRSLA
ncbi:VMAP-C domain-containing protein [Amycolatopsis thailandensis]|uniref:VMAP-C domain-containing protein n=1 Tax=Amycolatopsis thailandensis TaxID=589330 RepID=UPI0036352C8F